MSSRNAQTSAYIESFVAIVFAVALASQRYNVRTQNLGHRAAVMNNSGLLHYENLLLAKQQGLSAGKSIVGSIPAASEPGGDPVDMAAYEISADVRMRLKQMNGKLSRAVEDALTQIRQERLGISEECWHPISKARLEAVPWARHCKD